MSVSNICIQPITEIAIDRSDIRSNKKINNPVCIFLVVGRLVYRKGIDFLFDALEQIPDNTMYQIRIVGDGSQMNHLRQRCNNNPNLYNHVYYTGVIPYTEIDNEYYNANVLIMPSIRETTGSVVLEAMSKGLPVITINKFGAKMIVDENSGWLYDGNTKNEYIDNLKKVILECVMNPDEVTRRGINAIRKSEYYTWQNKVSEYQSIYEKILNDR